MKVANIQSNRHILGDAQINSIGGRGNLATFAGWACEAVGSERQELVPAIHLNDPWLPIVTAAIGWRGRCLERKILRIYREPDVNGIGNCTDNL